MEAALINVEGVKKTFEDKTALSSVSLSINKGSIFGLIGANGAGKTTLLKILAGVYTADQGKAEINSQPIFENTPAKSKTIFMPDTVFSFFQFSIKSMAKYYKSIYPTFSQERFEKLGSVFQFKTNSVVQRLSKGMQKQVAFWLVLSAMPEILLLDEPLDGLDPIIRAKIKSLLIQDVAEREMTVLISSHNLRELDDFCDSIGIIDKGRLVLQKELDSLKSLIHKIDAVFEVPPIFQAESGVEIVSCTARGKFYTIIAKGEGSHIETYLQQYKPIFLERAYVTLEEVFIHEMEALGYDTKNFIV